MKRILSIILVLAMLIPAIALADYSSMSDDDLNKELNLIRAELVKRAELKEGKQILADADGMTVTLKGEPELRKNYDGSYNLDIPVTVVNSSDKKIGIRTDEGYVNGWKVYASFTSMLDAGMKEKEVISVYKVNEEAELESLDDLEDIKLVFLSYDSNFNTLTRNIKTVITYK